MKGRRTPVVRPWVDDEASSAPLALSGERDVPEPDAPVPSTAPSDDLEEDDVSVHVRRTTPPPMSPEEYRQTLALTKVPESPLPPAQEADLPALTTPPSARRSESLAMMSAFLGEGYAPPRSSESAGEYRLDVPLAPPLPALSIPVPSEPQPSVAVSTERPTDLGATLDLSDRNCVLRLAVSKLRIAELALDHRSGFLLSLIDGKATVEEVLDMCAMPEPQALAILHELLRRGVVVVDLGRYAGRASS
jgi:hypothetical protein